MPGKIPAFRAEGASACLEGRLWETRKKGLLLAESCIQVGTVGETGQDKGSQRLRTTAAKGISEPGMQTSPESGEGTIRLLPGCDSPGTL